MDACAATGLGVDNHQRQAGAAGASYFFTGHLGSMAPARILVEASTESEWVARHLEAPGHEVVVADPNFAPVYATEVACRRARTEG